MSPSAPAAIAASESGSTSHGIPAACDGSDYYRKVRTFFKKSV